jgi:hypothetical protein
MLLVEAILTREEIGRVRCSNKAAGRLFEQVKSELPLRSTSNKGRSRRLEHLSWRTIADEVPKTGN